MYVNVFFLIRYLYSAVSLTLIKGQRFIRSFYYYYYYYYYYYLLTYLVIPAAFSLGNATASTPQAIPNAKVFNSVHIS